MTKSHRRTYLNDAVFLDKELEILDLQLHTSAPNFKYEQQRVKRGRGHQVNKIKYLPPNVIVKEMIGIRNRQSVSYTFKVVGLILYC